MERLTKKIFADGTIGLKNILDIEEINWSDADGKNKESTYCGKAIDRLAAYEDTGLTPEEVTTIAKSQIHTAANNVELLSELSEYREKIADAGYKVRVEYEYEEYPYENRVKSAWVIVEDGTP